MVIAVTLPGRMDPVRDELRQVAAGRPLFLAGPGVDERLMTEVRATPWPVIRSPPPGRWPSASRTTSV